jgi:hypothetical protein
MCCSGERQDADPIVAERIPVAPEVVRFHGFEALDSSLYYFPVRHGRVRGSGGGRKGRMNGADNGGLLPVLLTILAHRD